MRSVTQALLPFVALVVGFAAGTGFGVVVLSEGGDDGVADSYDSASAGARGARAGDRQELRKTVRQVIASVEPAPGARIAIDVDPVSAL